MRKYLILPLFLITIMFLSACGGAAPAEPAAEPTVDEPPTEAPSVAPEQPHCWNGFLETGCIQIEDNMNMCPIGYRINREAYSELNEDDFKRFLNAKTCHQVSDIDVDNYGFTVNSQNIKEKYIDIQLRAIRSAILDAYKNCDEIDRYTKPDSGWVFLVFDSLDNPQRHEWKNGPNDGYSTQFLFNLEDVNCFCDNYDDANRDKRLCSQCTPCSASSEPGVVAEGQLGTRTITA